MNGNKPDIPAGTSFGSLFTERIVAHNRVAYYPYPACGVLVLMVIDELLVGQAAANNPDVADALTQVATNTEATVLSQDSVPPPSDAIQIWRLNETPGDKPYPDVADAVWNVRSILTANGIPLEQVAPNHVLVPAYDYHACPWGPPDEPDKDPLGLGEASDSVKVTVIDSGFKAEGPIQTRVKARYGKWFTQTSPSATLKYEWVSEPGTESDGNGDGFLDALVGHANFVAGVIAQACPAATIDVVSHNGAFVEVDSPDTPISTEASVARSLFETLHEGVPGSDVINVGFAFPTLPAAVPTGIVVDGPPTLSFKVVLDSVRDREAVVIVAPAGNQSCSTPQYPAAFHLTYPNVVGVASITRADAPERSSFSNYGSWVACCTQGQDVVSTFIDGWSGSTEEPDPSGALPTKTFSGWASWSGTSFAAPKVAGEIARRASTGTAPLTCWNDLISGIATIPNLGVNLSGLPPT
jgi:thermitase